MRRLTNKEFIKRAKEIHNNRYDYSRVNYEKSFTKINIICPLHGAFQQTPFAHLQGQGCPVCGRLESRKNRANGKNIFIGQSIKIHKDFYDYSKVNYINAKTRVEIICPIHGSFWQKPNSHISLKEGCPLCKGEKIVKLKTYNLDDFIGKARQVHGDSYEYNLITSYKGAQIKLPIICKKHGIFYQTPNSHLQGQGCPVCKTSQGEKVICDFLNNHNIYYIPQYAFDGCRNKKPLPFDFYLPKYNMCIEFDGKQHFEVNDYFGGIKGFKNIKENDSIKTNYCKENNIKLIRIPYTDFDRIDEILEEEIV